MADSYIVPPVDDSPEALDIFFHQLCEQLNPSSELVEATAPTADYPADVTGVNAVGGYGTVRITFDPIGYDGHAYTLFVRSTDSNVNNAIAVGTTSTNVFIDNITEPDAFATYTYWAKNVNIYGIESTNWSSPSPTQLGVDFTYAVDVLLGKLGYDEFGNGAFPVRTEDVLPTLPDGDYPEGSVIILTTNQKLYINQNGSWVYKTPLSDVDGAGILAGLDAVTLSHVTDAGSLAALDTISSTEIDNNAITTPKIFAGAVVAGKIATDAVTANTIEANAIVAGKIAAGALVVDDGVMQNGYIKNALIENAAVTSAKISSINADQINVGTLTGFTIQTNSTPTTSGGVIQSGNHIRVYDTSGTLRVEIGELI